MRFSPRSLFGQNLLLIVGLIVVGQITTGLLFYRYVQRPRIEQLAEAVGAYVQAMSAVLADVPAAGRGAALARLNTGSGIEIAAASTAPLQSDAGLDAINLQVAHFVDALQAKLGPTRTVVAQSQRKEVWVRTPIAGSDYWIKLDADWVRLRFTGTWLVVSLCTGLLALLGAVLIQRRINRPLHRLANAARDVGKGRHPGHLSEDAPSEIAAVSASFNTMAADLARMESTRSEMLAGISHDLRTPLTKMRLGIAMQGDRIDVDSQAMLVRQIETMNGIIGQFIDHARDESSEVPMDCDPNRVVRELAEDFVAQGFVFVLDLGELPVCRLRPVAFQRLLGNLMQNAVHYGRVGLAIHTRAKAGTVQISVLDRGPGVPENRLAELTKPFVRHEQGGDCRSGAGLGLSIAERIARLEGGGLVLSLRDGGGLEARVRLPADA